MQECGKRRQSNRGCHDSQPVEPVEVKSNSVWKVTEDKANPKPGRADETRAGRDISNPVWLCGRLIGCLIDGGCGHRKHHSMALRVLRFSMRFMYRSPWKIASTKIPG